VIMSQAEWDRLRREDGGTPPPTPHQREDRDAERTAAWLERELAKNAAKGGLARLEWERANHRRNAAGWAKQVERCRQAGHDPGGLLDAIAEAEREADRCAAEIAQLEDAAHQERQRRARTRFADQGRRVGDALADKEDTAWTDTGATPQGAP
jgi:hypothetical protein